MSKIHNICGVYIDMTNVAIVGKAIEMHDGNCEYRVGFKWLSGDDVIILIDNNKDHELYFPRDKFVELWKSVVDGHDEIFIKRDQLNNERGYFASLHNVDINFDLGEGKVIENNEKEVENEKK